MEIDLNKLKHPNPLFAREGFIDLNGEWDFLFEQADVGIRAPRYKEFPQGSLKINVPYCYQSELSGINSQDQCETVWYQKDVRFDFEKGRRVLLHFEGSDYRTRVYVNSHLVGEHKGGYTSFCFDITDYLEEGFAHIAVRCDDAYDLHQPRGKQKWRKEPFACWYQEVTGIWKSVYAEIVSPVYVKDFKLTPKEGGIAEIEVALSEQVEKEVEVSFCLGGKEVGLAKGKAKAGLFKGEAKLGEIAYWNIDSPSLYEVKIRVLEEKGIADEVSTIFGYRFIEAKDGKILLNGKPLFMRLTLEQGYYPKGIYTFENVDEMIKEAKLIQDLGFNGLRMHQKIEDQRFYYLCDLLGLIVWCEFPSCYDFDEDSVSSVTREWNEVLRQNYNHPSILVWVPCNESWGLPDLSKDKDQQRFLCGLYDLTKAFDPMRLVVSNDGWEHVKSDLVTLHNYAQDPKQFKEYCDRVMEIVKNNESPELGGLYKTFANGFHYEGQPILFDEFCGIGFDLEKNEEAWGYGEEAEGEEEFLNRYSSLIKTASECPYLAGWCMTQLSDVYQEKNGLVTFARTPKADVKKLKSINEQ